MDTFQSPISAVIPAFPVMYDLAWSIIFHLSHCPLTLILLILFVWLGCQVLHNDVMIICKDDQETLFSQKPPSCPLPWLSWEPNLHVIWKSPQVTEWKLPKKQQYQPKNVKKLYFQCTRKASGYMSYHKVKKNQETFFLASIKICKSNNHVFSLSGLNMKKPSPLGSSTILAKLKN